MFWSPFGGALAFACVVIHTFAGVAWQLTAIVVGVVGTALVIAVGNTVHTATMFKHLKCSQRDQIVTLCRIAVGAYILWTLLFVFRPLWWPIWLTALPVLVGSVYWGCRYQEWRIARMPEETPVPYMEPEKDPLDGNPDVRKARRLLLDAGLPNMKVVSHQPVVDEEGEQTANQFVIRTTGTGKQAQ